MLRLLGSICLVYWHVFSFDSGGERSSIELSISWKIVLPHIFLAETFGGVGSAPTTSD